MLLYVLEEIWTGDKGKTKNEEQKKKQNKNKCAQRKKDDTNDKEGMCV